MPDINTIQSWLEEAYNDRLTVYPYGDRARLTNGSAAHYVDVFPSGGEFHLRGERYGERIHEDCEATRDALIDLLSRTI